MVALALRNSGIQEELLSPNLSGPLEMLLSTIEPGSDSEGDSFSFKSTDVHRCANPGEVPVRVIWVITPPHY